MQLRAPNLGKITNCITLRDVRAKPDYEHKCEDTVTVAYEMHASFGLCYCSLYDRLNHKNAFKVRFIKMFDLTVMIEEKINRKVKNKIQKVWLKQFFLIDARAQKDTSYSISHFTQNKCIL